MTFTPKTAALLPCPFCGGQDVKLYHQQTAIGAWVACRSCGMEAPTETGVTADQAVKYWNTRAPQCEVRRVDAVAWRHTNTETGHQGLWREKPDLRGPFVVEPLFLSSSLQSADREGK